MKSSLHLHPVKLAIDALMLAAIAVAPSAIAKPQGGAVVAGQVRATPGNGSLVLRQTSERAVMNWRSFDIARGEKVRVAQPSASAAMLARVTGGGGASAIDGSLFASGRFFLINPQGVLIGRDAVIDTGAFLASTLSVRDRDFMAGGDLVLRGDGSGDVVNLGQIRAADGSVTLVGRSVRNEGGIAAPQGTATLAAASEFVLSSDGAPGLLVKGTAGTVAGTAVDNKGLVAAAQVQLQAARGNLYALAINQSGIVRATGTAEIGGRVVLSAAGGRVEVGGQVAARDADGSGGVVAIGGGARGKDAAVPNATDTVVHASALIDVAAAGRKGAGGQATVWADQSTRFLGAIAADAGNAGGNGGLVEVSGAKSLVFSPRKPVSLSAAAGSPGTLLLDPDAWTIGTVDGANQMSATTLRSQLQAGNFVLDSSTGAGDITFDAPVSWTSGSTFTVRSGNGINVNKSITASGNGVLKLYAGIASNPTVQGNLPLNGNVAVAAAATITARRLTLGGNTLAAVAGYEPTNASSPGPGSFNVDGKLDVGTLELDLAGGQAGVVAVHAQNRIGVLQTAGTGDLGYVNVANSSGALAVKLVSNDSTTPYVQVATPGDLTLSAGMALDLAGAAQVVLASTGGNVTNQAGASAITGSGSHLVYTGTAALTVKGGLGGTDVFSRSFAGNPPGDYTDGASRFLFRAAGATLPELTYRADDKARLYGDANPLLTYSIQSGSGPVSEASLSGQVSGQPNLATAAVPTSGVQSYVIVITRGSLASTSYDFNFVNGQLTVNPAPLTIAARAATRYYGDANPLFGADVSGLKNGETAASILSGIGLASGATAASNAGGYTITPNVTSVNGNYTYTLQGATLTVRPAPVTVALAEQRRAYGDANPDFLLQASASGLKNLQGLPDAFPLFSLATSAGASSAIGTYAVTASGLSNPNYAVTTNLSAMRVVPAVLTVQAGNGSRMYGDANPVFTTNVSGFKNGETVAVVSGLRVGTTATAASDVGSYAVRGRSASAANYSFQYVDGTLAVTPAPLTVDIDDQSRIFGAANPRFTYDVSGLRNGDAAPSFAMSTAAGTISRVGSYAVHGTGSSANYAVTFLPGTLTVGKAPVVLTGTDATRTYGDANPQLSFTADGLLASDEAYLGFWRAGTAATARSNAGSYAITVARNPDAAPLVSLFTNLPNYDVRFAPGTLTVDKAPVVLLAQPVAAVWGSRRPALTWIVSGLKPWDDKGTFTGVALTSAPDGPMVGGVPTAVLQTPDRPEPTPGKHVIGFASTGTSQNYRVTNAVPSVFTVTPIRYVITVPDATATANALPASFAYDAPAQFANGPKFRIEVVADVPPGAKAGTFNLRATLPDVKTDEHYDTLGRYYRVEIAGPGKLVLLPALEPIVLPSMPELVTLAPLTTGSPMVVALRTGPFGAADVADLMRGSGSDLIAEILKFMRAPDNGFNNGYSEAFINLPQDQKEALMLLTYGSAGMSMDDAAAQFASNPTLRAAMAPILAGYAMSLLSTEGRLSPAQERLVTSVTAKLNEQRAQVARTVQAKFESWAAVQGKRGLMDLYSMSIPDFVGAARQSVVADVMTKVGAAAAGGAVGVASAAIFSTSAVVTAVFPYSYGVILTAGPIGVAIGAAVAMGAIAADQAVKSDANMRNYTAYMADAARPVADIRNLDLSQGGNKFDAFTAVMGVFNGVF